MSSASGLSERNISSAPGVSASATPAARPATGLATRRTALYSSPTEATPSRAWGTRSDHELNPKIRPDSSITHKDAGGLSTVIELPASSEPKKNALQILVAACPA